MTAELEQEKCSPDKVTTRISLFTQRLSMSQDIKACGCCGKRQIISDDHLQYTDINLRDEILNKIKLTDKDMQRYHKAGDFRKAMSVWPGIASGRIQGDQ